MLTGGDGTEIPLALSELRSMFHVRAGVSRGWALGYQPRWGIVFHLAVQGAEHICLVCSPVASSMEHQKPLWSTSLNTSSCVKILIAGGLNSSHLSYS